MCPTQRLVLFTRYPTPGATKTRLIPVLGARVAAELHRRLAERFLRRMCGVDFQIEVWFSGGSVQAMEEWLGRDLVLRSQPEGDLGNRMRRAFEETLGSGAERTVLAGSDIPGIDGETVRDAFGALDDHDLVLGPAEDGGYYLIGMRKPCPSLFEGVEWGGERVLDQTLEIAKDLGLRVRLLRTLADLDRPRDLERWREDPEGLLAGIGLPALSVIVPTLNEEASLGGTLDALKVAGGKDFESVEIVVVDGGSRDRTVEIAKSRGTQVFECPPGRGRQMDLGAREAVGDILLFLHADSIPPRCYLPLILQALDRPDVVAGAFSLRIDSAGFAYRLIDGVTNWRARFLRSPYGDQGLFLKASVFKDLGGFRDLPILEDFDLVRRLRRRGRICILPEAVCASPRRWVKRGLLRTWLMNQTMLAGYYMGVSPVRLSQFYYGTK